MSQLDPTPTPTPAPAPVADPAPTADPAPASAVAAAVAAAPDPVVPAAPAPNVPQEWMQILPAELQADPNLARYKSVEALARGHLETKAAVGAPKLPAPDAALDSFEPFHAVRPADAAAYQVDVPEGYPAEYGDGFRAVAHEIGLHPAQAAKLVQWNNDAIAAQMGAEVQAANAEVEQFKRTITASGGNYDASLTRVAAMLAENGLGDEAQQSVALNALEKQLGAAPALKMLFTLAEKFGEPAPPPINLPDGSSFTVAGQSAAAIAAQRKQLQQNPEWRTKAQTEGTPEHLQYQQLVAAEARAVERGQA